MKILPSLRGGALAAVFLCSPGLRAQTTPAAPAAPSAPAAGDDIIKLSQFDVTSQKANGYQAANSISATGIGVKSYDVPLPIMTITSEYLSDISAGDIRDAVQYVPGVVTDPRNEAAFTLRGFSGNIVYRDGFYRRQNYQTWDIERVEVIEGPASIFFGSVRPGGIINYVTKRPEFNQDYADLYVQTGSFSLIKGQLSYNGAAGPDVAYRINVGSLNSNGSGYQYDFLNEDHVSAAFRMKISDRQELNIYADRERRDDYLDERGYALTHPGYIGNAAAIASGQSVTAWVAANFGASAPVFTSFAPIYPPKDVYGRGYAYNTDNFEKFMDWDLDVDYLLKLGDHVVFETALSRGQDDQPGLRDNNGDETPFADGHVNMQYQYFENDRNSYVWNNKLTAKFKLGSIDNTLQLGQQFQEVITDQPGYITPAGSFTTNNLSAIINNFYPATSPVIQNAYPLVFANQPINDWKHANDITTGYYVALQSGFFDDRVHLLAGARYDVINGSIGYSIRPTNATGEGRTTAATPQIGVIGEIIPGLSAFATYSRSIEPQNGSVDVFGTVAGPVKSKGVDTGFKTNFLDGRISSTLDFYFLQRLDIATTDTARQLATGLSPLFIFGTANEANGVSFDSSIVVTDHDQLIVGVQHMTKANITGSPAPNQNLIGQPLADVPTNMFSLWDRYEFSSGPLSGLVVGAGGRYSGAAPISSALNETVKDPSFTVFNGLLGYPVPIFGRQVKVQFNVDNFTNKIYRDGPEGMFGMPRKFMISLETRF